VIPRRPKEESLPANCNSVRSDQCELIKSSGQFTGGTVANTATFLKQNIFALALSLSMSLKDTISDSSLVLRKGSFIPHRHENVTNTSTKQK